METPLIILLIIIFVILVIIFYYFWYIHKDNNFNREISYKLIYDNESTIVDIFRKVSHKYCRYPALKKKEKNKWTTITYKKFYNIADSLAKKLLYHVGLYPKIGILSYNRPEWLSIHMGILMSTGISIGIHHTSSEEHCSYIVNHSDIDLLVVENNKQLSKFKNLKIPSVKYILIIDYNDTNFILKENINMITKNNKVKILSLDDFINNKISTTAISTTIDYNKPKLTDTASIIYTSGTTGNPKGVVLTHGNIMASIKASIYAIQSRTNINIYIQERFISYLPLNHIAAQIMDIYLPISLTGIIHFSNKEVLKNSLKDILKEVKPTIFIGVPRIWEKIMEKIQDTCNPENMINKLIVNKLILKEIGLSKTKYCITTAGPINIDVINFFKLLGIELCNIYGMSETSGPISMAVPGFSKGTGIPIVDIKIDSLTNEILVKGDMVFKKYHKDDITTNNSFKKKWFKTGDTGYLDRDGTLYVTGRIKDIIITVGGENISPIPIEEKLLKELNKNDKLFDHAIIIGDKRKYLSVLLIPNNNYQNNKDINIHIDKSIKVINNKVANNLNTIKKHLIIDNKSFKEEEFLTSSLKLKRNYINNKYKKEIDNLYE